ncbi:MAG: T9SS type A sorting domain-containing protein [Sphingobacteriales bacterium]|nr:MAG: T9SS type A sorting domain-containing protein [Sphingobacteriales bacterium]
MIIFATLGILKPYSPIMAKKLYYIILLLLFHSVSYAQYASRSSAKSSNPYRGSYQRMAVGPEANHSFELRNGSLWGSGRNDYGQLGDSTYLNRSVAVRIGTDTSWVCVSTGNRHTVALKSNGTLWAWGNNSRGQVGDGTVIDRIVPIRIGNDNNWVSIAAGTTHTLAIKGDGTLWAWGFNGLGQLGDGTDTDRILPVRIGNDSNWVSISASSHSLALKSDGSLWSWGYNGAGQLGLGSTLTVTINSPSKIGRDYSWVRATTGVYHSAALKSDGTLWTWGYNNYGQLGDGTTVQKDTPVQIGTDQNWVSIAAGLGQTYALRSNGTLWAWGNNNKGQLGDGTNIGKTTPVQIDTTTTWVSIAGGQDCGMGLRSNGKLWGWGDNQFGQLGDSTTINKNVPVFLRASNHWLSVLTGASSTAALKSDGTLWTWGYNNYGQLGDGTRVQKDIPVQIGADQNWVSVSLGGSHALALKSNGTLWAWGDNTYGQLGNGSSGTLTATPTPVQVGADDNWVSISAGLAHNLALKSNGELWGWGYNSTGQVGNGTTRQQNTPVRCGRATSWVQVSAGSTHSMGLQSEGTRWAWGDNQYGQVGDNTTTNRSAPVPIVGGSLYDWTNVSAGHYHSLALKGDGGIWAWGANQFGQLGVGNTTNVLLPEKILTLDNCLDLAATFQYSVAVRADGFLYGWGDNQFGALGVGNSVPGSVITAPVLTPGVENIVSLSKGSQGLHTAVISTTRRTVCLTGSNSQGQLGTGTQVSTSTYNCNNSICLSYYLPVADRVFLAQPITGTGNRTYFQQDCMLASSLVPTGAFPVRGTATTRVFVDATVQNYNGQAYVQRHYDIEPDSNATTGTAEVTLYFTQDEFTAFNAVRGILPSLPINSADSANNRANLRITQFHGLPSGGNAPANYPSSWGGVGPASILVTPSSVSWDQDHNWWTVTFPVTGFSGFFASTNQSSPLPLKLVNFRAVPNGNSNALNWTVAAGKDGTRFWVERSIDGRTFETIGEVIGDRNVDYHYDDWFIDFPISYYRLKFMEPTGDYIYSNIAIVRRNLKSGTVVIEPVPAANAITVTNTDITLSGSNVIIFNLQGQPVYQFKMNIVNHVDISKWPVGIYVLKFADGGVMKMEKR